MTFVSQEDGTWPGSTGGRQTKRPAASHTYLADIAIVAIIIFLRLASPATAGMAYLLLGVYAFGGRSHIVKALVLSWLCTMISPGLAPSPSIGGLGRYIVLLGASASALIWSGFGIRHFHVHRLTLTTIGLGTVIVIHSIMISPIPDVSILKAVSWTMTLTALMSAWIGMPLGQREQTVRFLFAILVFVAVASLPLLGLNSIGRLRNGTGFQGILNHPQAFGPAMGILAAWSISLFVSQPRPDYRLILLAGLSAWFVILSEARTGGLAVFVGLVLGGASIVFLTGIRPGRLFPGLSSMRLWGAFFVLIVAMLPFLESILDSLQFYLTKSGRAAGSVGVLEAYDKSRGGLIEEMLTNIRSKPLIGNGFGVASDPASMLIERDPILGLPTSASVEKGVVPIMVAEELGIPLALLVAAWVFQIVRKAAFGGFTPLVVLLTILALNMGEAILFSPGGQGLLILILFSWGATCPPTVGRRHRRG